jgi:hypothetical protein
VTLSVAPKTGTRGAFETRDRPFRREHDASTLQRPRPPQTFEACAAWFREAWEASLPARMHTRGVEDGSALGSPRMAGALHRRTDHASPDGWGVTGWDRDGQPRGIDRATGLTLDPFLFYLETMLRGRVRDEHGQRTEKRTVEALGATALVRWAYLGWDLGALIHETWRRSPNHEDDYNVPAMRALLETTIRRLWDQYQREPVRWVRCVRCHRRDCVCGERSESQINAEEMG